MCFIISVRQRAWPETLGRLETNSLFTASRAQRRRQFCFGGRKCIWGISFWAWRRLLFSQKQFGRKRKIKGVNVCAITHSQAIHLSVFRVRETRLIFCSGLFLTDRDLSLFLSQWMHICVASHLHNSDWTLLLIFCNHGIHPSIPHNFVSGTMTSATSFLLKEGDPLQL